MHLDNEKLLINLIEKRKIFWEPIVGGAILLAGILGTMVPLYIHSDNRMEKLVEAIRQDVKEFHEEMKQFHGRMCAIEEKNKSN